MTDQELALFLVETGVPFAAVAEVPRNVVRTVGARNLLEADDIFVQYFRDVPALVHYLEGQLLPRTIRQGNVTALICQPEAGVIVGLFYEDERDLPERVRRGRELDAMLRRRWHTAAP